MLHIAPAPAPPPRPDDGAIQDLQRSGWSRWSPRRAGMPPLMEWWPAYVLLALLAVLAVLVTLRFAVELLAPLAEPTDADLKGTGRVAKPRT